MDHTELRGLAFGISDETIRQIIGILSRKKIHCSVEHYSEDLAGSSKGKLEYYDFYWLLPESIEIDQVKLFQDKSIITFYIARENSENLPESYRFANIDEAASFLTGFGVQKSLNRTTELTKKTDQEILDLVFEASTESISITDINGNFTRVNRNTARLLGYPDIGSLVGVNILQVVHPDYHQQAWYVRNKAFETGKSENQVLGFVRKNGTMVEIIINLYLYHDSNNSPCGFIGFTNLVHNIDGIDLEGENSFTNSNFFDKKKAAELKEAYVLLESEVEKRKHVESHRDILSRILEETSDIVAYTGPDLKLIYMNKAGMDYFGITSQTELQQLTPDDFQAVEDHDKFRLEVFPTARKNGFWRGGSAMRDRTGKRIEVSQVVVCHHLINGDIVFSTIARDMTEEKQKEAQLFQSQAWYKALSEAAHDMIFAISPEDTILYLNSFAGQAIKVDPISTIGKPRAQYFGDLSSNDMYKNLQRVLETGNPSYHEELMDFKYSSMWLGTWLVPISNPGEKPIAVLGISRDISTTKRSEEQLINSLEREKELSDLKSLFISMTSHEFRTPLSTILSSVELLEIYSKDWSDEKKTKHYRQIKEAVTRMNDTLEDILTIGRMESVEQKIKLTLIDPTQTLSTMVDEIIQADHGQHKINLSIEGECQSSLFDIDSLRRIIENLVSNSIKYSSRDSSVWIRMVCKPDGIEIHISDQGIGISADEIKLVLEPFYRGKNVSTISGTGLGLTIVHQAVVRSGGTMKMNPTPKEERPFL